MENYSSYAKTKIAEFEPKRKYQPHELLLMLRQRSGLSKIELAKLLGLSSARMLQKWEGAYGVPTAERLHHLIEIYHSKNVFVAGKELEEIRLLWTTIQNYYDATHPSYEGYPVFDAGWFEKMLKGQTPLNLRVLPQKVEDENLSASEPAPDEIETPSIINPTNLPPLELTRFIGRPKELSQIIDLLIHQKHRLVTLCGTGGIGKTRLSLQVARQILPNFKDGVWLVELAGLSSVEQLPLFIAKALDFIQQIPAKDVTLALQKQLKTKQLLIILDNCEHLLSACTELADSLLKTCPEVQILATSRERLGILGEVVLPLLPLTFPPRSFKANLADLQQFEAVQLFCNRAKLVEPTFALTEQDVPALTQICQKLDGIPLALELAASRVNMLTLEQINERLADRFKLLTKGNPTAFPRHQTLRALLDWSFQLLTLREQKLFIRLAVFSGGWVLEAAEAICSDPVLEAQEILDTLDSLVVKSLVIVDKQGQIPRYRFLETIRQYAAELFAQSNEVIVFQEQHIGYYVRLAEQAEAEIETPQQTVWLNRLNQEYENFIAGFNRLWESQRWELVLGLVNALARYWHWLGYSKQLRHWLEQALQEAEKTGMLVEENSKIAKRLTKSLLRLSQVVFHQDEIEVALAYAKRGLTLAERVGDAVDRGFGNRLIAMCLIQKGDYNPATRYLEQSAAYYREADHQEGISSTFFELAVIANLQNNLVQAVRYMRECTELRVKIGAESQLTSSYNALAIFYRELGDYSNSRHFLEQGLTLCRKINNRDKLGMLLNNLSGLTIIEGFYDQTQTIIDQAIVIERELGSKQGEAVALHNSGWLKKCLGDYQAAQTFYQMALTLRREMGDTIYITYSLNNLGEIAILQGEYRTARELLNSGLTHAQTSQHKTPIAQSYLYLGYLEYKVGNFMEAKAYLEKAIEIHEERQNNYEIAKNLTWLICINYQEGNLVEARRLVDKLDSLLAATTGVLEPHYRIELGKLKLKGVHHVSNPIQ
jgi:predicted ATPase/Tfp pilus assembly protein PilF/transcriptional regulator with XRE-family HTH domain